MKNKNINRWILDSNSSALYSVSLLNMCESLGYISSFLTTFLQCGNKIFFVSSQEKAVFKLVVLVVIRVLIQF